MKLAKFILLVVGIFILCAAVQRVGVATLYANILELRWRIIPLYFIYFFVYAFNAVGWEYAYATALPQNIRFRNFFVVRLIGETLNAVVPFSASLGGEPIKAELLKRRFGVPLSQTYASLLTVHTTLWASLNIFVIGALLVTLESRPLSPFLWKCVLTFLLLLAIGGIGLIIGLYYGLFKKLFALGEHFHWWGDTAKEKKMKFLKLDDEIKRFYGQHRDRFFCSVFFNLCAWFVGVVEVFYLGKILGMNLSLSEAWLFEALIQVLRIVTFMVPSSIGTQEGGILLLFSQFGYAGPVSLTFAIVRRLRELCWAALGLSAYFFFQDSRRETTHS